MQQLMPGMALEVDPRRIRRAWLMVLLLAAVPCGCLLAVALSSGRSSGADYGAIALVFVAIVLVGVSTVWFAFRPLWAIGRDYVEVHARVVQRTQLVDAGGRAAGPIHYAFEFENPKTGRVDRGTIAIERAHGGPLYATIERSHLVVLVCSRRPAWFCGLRSDGFPFLLHRQQLEELRHRLVERHLPLEIGLGLRNELSLRRALRTLLGAEARGQLPARPEQGQIELPELEGEDPVLEVQGLARTIALAYRFDPGPLLVTWRDDLDAAGIVEYQPGEGFFIDLRRDLLAQPAELKATLAHEVAHVFLGSHGIHDSDRFDLEVKTDLAAALWGFGAALLACHDVFRHTVGTHDGGGGVLVSEKVGRGGYLTGEELAYALAKVYPSPLLLRVSRDLPRLARRALRAGIRKARREARLGVFAEAPWHRRCFYRFQKRLACASWSSQLVFWRRLFSRAICIEDQKVVFPCPRCTQRMRVPLDKSGTASCPTCRMPVLFAS